MSEVETNSPAAPAAPVASPVPAVAAAAPAPAKNALQIVEEQIVAFIQQREKAIANVHAIEGALQASQHLLGVLKAEALKAEAAAKAAVEAAKAEAEKAATKAETVAEEVVTAVEAEAKKL